jgi:hypothetical protein
MPPGKIIRLGGAPLQGSLGPPAACTSQPLQPIALKINPSVDERRRLGKQHWGDPVWAVILPKRYILEVSAAFLILKE